MHLKAYYESGEYVYYTAYTYMCGPMLYILPVRTYCLCSLEYSDPTRSDSKLTPFQCSQNLPVKDIQFLHPCGLQGFVLCTQSYIVGLLRVWRGLPHTGSNITYTCLECVHVIIFFIVYQPKGNQRKNRKKYPPPSPQCNNNKQHNTRAGPWVPSLENCMHTLGAGQTNYVQCIDQAHVQCFPQRGGRGVQHPSSFLEHPLLSGCTHQKTVYRQQMYNAHTKSPLSF